MWWELANGRFALMTAAPIGLVQPPHDPTYSIEPSEGAPMPTRVNGDRDTSWHPPSSLLRHGLQWMFMPLIAFAIFDFGPAVLTPIAYILSLMVHLGSLSGLPPRLPDPLTLLLQPPILMLALWPFLVLYSTTRGMLIEQPEEWKSIRLATIAATFAMSLPSVALLVGVPLDLVSPARDAGQGTGFLCLFFMLLLWIPGVIGWLIGRGIAWMLHP
jgi:hypothetical protein